MDISLNTLENVEEVKIKKAVPAVLALMIFALVCKYLLLFVHSKISSISDLVFKVEKIEE